MMLLQVGLFLRLTARHKSLHEENGIHHIQSITRIFKCERRTAHGTLGISIGAKSLVELSPLRLQMNIAGPEHLKLQFAFKENTH